MELNEIHPYTAHVSESLKVLCGPNSALLRICEEFFYKSTGPSAQINKVKVISGQMTRIKVVEVTAVCLKVILDLTLKVPSKVI